MPKGIGALGKLHCSQAFPLSWGVCCALSHLKEIFSVANNGSTSSSLVGRLDTNTHTHTHTHTHK